MQYREALAQYNFRPEHPNDLQLIKGDLVAVSEWISKDWLKGQIVKPQPGQRQNDNKTGIFPLSFVQFTGVMVSLSGEDGKELALYETPANIDKRVPSGVQDANFYDEPNEDFLDYPPPPQPTNVAVGRLQPDGPGAPPLPPKGGNAFKHSPIPPVVPSPHSRGARPPVTSPVPATGNNNHEITVNSSEVELLKDQVAELRVKMQQLEQFRSVIVEWMMSGNQQQQSALTKLCGSSAQFS